MTAASYRERFLDFRAPSYPASKIDYPQPLGNVIRFLDTHLDESLLLKRVILLPNLASELATITDDTISNFPPLDTIPDKFFVMTDATLTTVEHGSDTYRMQAFGVGRPAVQLGSSRFITPEQPEQFSVLTWTATPRLSTDYDEEDPHPFLAQNRALRIIEKQTLDSDADMFQPEVLRRISDMQRRIPYCCLGVFFSPAAHNYLVDMESLTRRKTFAWEQNSRCTGKSSKTCVSVTDDASVSLWTLPPQTTTRERPHTKTFEYFTAGNIWPTAREGRVPTARDYVQRAWVNAVRIDSTVILFDCGKSMRIGIRHRRTQTLYLSDLIVSSSVDGPPYGKIVGGLYLAIAHDLANRHAHLREPSPERRSRKRSHEPEDSSEGPSAASTRSALIVREQSTDEAKRNLDTCFARRLLAIYMQIDFYHSPSPLALYRAGSSRERYYRPKEYLALILHSRLAAGATGHIYLARIGPNSNMPSGVTNYPFVIKMATTVKKLTRLKHEYEVYMHLKSANVKGIPHVFGYFQDPDHEAGALIVSYSGRALGERILHPPGKVELSVDEISQLRDIVKSFHACGVLHGDLRSWNMLRAQDGSISIIDFDSSSIKIARQVDYEAESRRLESFIRGKYIDKDPVLVPTRSESQSEVGSEESETEED